MFRVISGTFGETANQIRPDYVRLKGLGGVPGRAESQHKAATRATHSFSSSRQFVEIMKRKSLSNNSRGT